MKHHKGIPVAQKIIVIVFGIIILALFAVLIFVPRKSSPASSDATYIATTTVPTGGNVALNTPLPNVPVKSPLVVTGNVIGGGWFFEGVFPIKVLDANGKVLGQGQARAEGDWTSTGTVPFKATIPFTMPHSSSGILMMSKDNPSGLPQNNVSLTMPIMF